MSRTGESSGKGNPEGVVASESANNSSVCGALAPMFALGIPGSASAAVLIGGLTIQGLEPGPFLFADTPQIPYTVFASLFSSERRSSRFWVFSARGCGCGSR